MNIAVDIGNTNLKCAFFLPDEGYEVHGLGVDRLHDMEVLYRNLFCWDVLPKKVLTADAYPAPVTWQIAQTGRFPQQKLQVAIRRIRPQDKFAVVSRKHIPIKIAAKTPDKVGIDRLLAAFAATELYGDAPMLVIDAGSALTVDVVQNRTFCGGAILPGLVPLSETYPIISHQLPTVPIPRFPDCAKIPPPVFPGKSTEDAIHCGLYWGTIGAIMQCCGMFFRRTEDVRLVLAGGDSQYLLPELARLIPSQQIKHNRNLVLEGINLCFQERRTC